LGLLIPHSLARIHCCHWDLGRFEAVCGEVGGGVMCDRLLGEARQAADLIYPEQASQANAPNQGEESG